MIRTILSIYLLLLAGLSASAQDSTAFIKSSGQVLEYLKSQKYQAVVDLIDPDAKPRPDSARIGSAWRNLLKGAGAYKSINDTLYQHQPNYDMVVFQCAFESRKIDIKTIYGKSGKLKGVFFLPTDERERYSNPAYFHPELIEETAFEVVNGDVRLRGMLTVPKNKGKVPVVILVHGSGPNDKDESVGATKIFRDLSYGLSYKGLAVLRYDKRTRALAAMLRRSNVIMTPEEETIADAVAAAALIKKDPRIDTTRIFIVGHGMGAYLLPLILERIPGVSGGVMLTPHARPLNQLLIEQSEYVLQNDKNATPEKKSLLDSLKLESAKVDALSPANAGDSTQLMGLHPAYWLFLKNYDAFAKTKAVQKPLLLVFGGRDYQVTSKDETIWVAKMKGQQRITFKSYKDLNHFFVKGSGKSTPDEYLKAGNVDERMVFETADWVIATSGTK